MRTVAKILLVVWLGQSQGNCRWNVNGNEGGDVKTGAYVDMAVEVDVAMAVAVAVVMAVNVNVDVAVDLESNTTWIVTAWPHAADLCALIAKLAIPNLEDVHISQGHTLRFYLPLVQVGRVHFAGVLYPDLQHIGREHIRAGAHTRSADRVNPWVQTGKSRCMRYKRDRGAGLCVSKWSRWNKPSGAGRVRPTVCTTCSPTRAPTLLLVSVQSSVWNWEMLGSWMRMSQSLWRPNLHTASISGNLGPSLPDRFMTTMRP